jgi:hypothetical protein
MENSEAFLVADRKNNRKTAENEKIFLCIWEKMGYNSTE